MLYLKSADEQADHLMLNQVNVTLIFLANQYENQTTAHYLPLHPPEPEVFFEFYVNLFKEGK